MHNNAFHSTYPADRIGKVELSCNADEHVAGSFGEFVLTYTAGYFGIDDTGSLKIVHRFASDMGKPQFADPEGWNYVTAEASNGAMLELRYDQKGNIRPWDKTIHIKVQRGFLQEGDTITLRLGDRRKGSPGMRVQTFSEPTFEYKFLVDAFATYNFVEVPDLPTIRIIGGPPVLFKASVPTLRKIGDVFQLGFKGEDRWGNPSPSVSGRFRFETSLPIDGLPTVIDYPAGALSQQFKDLTVSVPGELVVTVLDASGSEVCRSNPMNVVDHAALLPFWGDLHGQSEETIGTNSARDLILFARDHAFLDVMSHQGNDFQITQAFWEELNQLTAEFDQEGEFVIFPGYEWSGNTGLGGDRNVMFRREGRQIRRSHHALIDDLSDIDTDANSASALFELLQQEDCLVFAHIGGRYADIKMAHDGRLERSVEVHSDWGTFEWLIEDALEQGYRVGILANSDGHKGRHGASHPGASLFGAYGGLSCILSEGLNRDAIFDALRKRHHYATTGCRIHVSTAVVFGSPAELFDDDPNMGGKPVSQVTSAMMGDILRSDARSVTLEIEVNAASPIERIEIRNGKQVLEIWRPYIAADLGQRIRVIWEGSEYRGRGRQSVWDGSATLTDGVFAAFEPINMWNLDKQIVRESDQRLSWKALTTGGFGGFDAVLGDGGHGSMVLDTALVKAEIALSEIGMEDITLGADGGIKRQMRVFRLPDILTTKRVSLRKTIDLQTGSADNVIYLCITLEDGNLIWTSPTYVIR